MKRELRMAHFFNKKEAEILIGVFPELTDFVTDIDGKHFEIEDEYEKKHTITLKAIEILSEHFELTINSHYIDIKPNSWVK